MLVISLGLLQLIFPQNGEQLGLQFVGDFYGRERIWKHARCRSYKQGTVFDLSFLFHLLSNRFISCRRRILEGHPVYRTGHTIASGGGSVRACPAQTQNVTQARIEGDGSLETCIQAQKQDLCRNLRNALVKEMLVGRQVPLVNNASSFAKT